MSNFLKERILANWEDTKDPRTELEAFLTLKEYLKSPTAEMLINYDPQIHQIHNITSLYLTAWQLYRHAIADSSEAKRLEEENPNAEGEIATLYQNAEENLTEALQILTDIDRKGVLYNCVRAALMDIPMEVRR